MEPLRILSVLLAIVLICILTYLITRQVKDYYTSRDPLLQKLKNEIEMAINREKNVCLSRANCKLKEQIDKNGGPKKCLSHVSLHEADSSYTINKHKVHLCIKNDKGEYYDENMLIYVLAHELAHVLCDSVGHTEEWQEIFDELLDCLERQNVYDSSKPLLKDYCNYT